MSDYSPLRLAENGHSPSSQSLGSQGSHGSPGGSNNANKAAEDIRIGNNTHRTKNHSNDIRTSHLDGHRIQHADHQQHHNHRGRENGTSRTRSQSESSTKSGQLRYAARNVIELFVPVSLCMIIVVGTIKATDSYRYSSQSVIWYAQMMFTDQTVDTGTRVLHSFANAFIMLMCIMVMTTLLIVLYKFRCYKTIHAWLILSSLMMLFMFTLMYISEILRVYNIPIDNYTLALLIWNFGVVGMICIHWKGPLLLQQGYLITISALMALALIRCLPDWTTWTALAVVSIWDLVAVLCPRGPLRILVETAQERNESIFPALIYSSTMVWEISSGILSTGIISTIPSVSMADNGSRHSSKKVNSSSKGKRSNRHSANLSTSNDTSSVRANRAAEIVSPIVKRDQHPVEIHYEDSAEPPKVSFVQPIASPDIGEDFHRPVVRALNVSSTIQDRRSIALGDGDVEPSREADSTESTINYEPQQNHQRTEHHQAEEERGVKLGLGDFIFFSVLVGKASSHDDWNITIACYVSILVGLCLTLSLLAVFRKALPALPISIAFGMCSYFLSYIFVVPFAEQLAINQVFI